MAIFICTGLSSFAPIAHAILVFGLTETLERSGLPYYLLEGLLHSIGILFYAVSAFQPAVLFFSNKHVLYICKL